MMGITASGFKDVFSVASNCRRYAVTDYLFAVLVTAVCFHVLPPQKAKGS